MITNSVMAALAAWTPPQGPAQLEKKFLSRKDLCDQFGIAYPTLDRLVKTGVLPTVRVGLHQRRELEYHRQSDLYPYTYGNSSNPNWATTIADGSGSALGYPNTSGTFSFDAAGTQTTYSAKSITAITYNHLNLPTKYTWSGSSLEIQYACPDRPQNIKQSGELRECGWQNTLQERRCGYLPIE